MNQTLRVHGNWFVSQVAVGDRAPKTVQTLRLTYTDWGGEHRTTWLRRVSNGDYRFFTISPDGTEKAIDPATCRGENTCTNSGEIQYVGPDGVQYRASLRPYAPAVGTPTFSRSRGWRPLRCTSTTRPRCRRAEASGVFGVPTFVFDGELFWGGDRIGLLRERLDEKGVKRRLVGG